MSKQMSIKIYIHKIDDIIFKMEYTLFFSKLSTVQSENNIMLLSLHIETDRMIDTNLDIDINSDRDI